MTTTAPLIRPSTIRRNSEPQFSEFPGSSRIEASCKRILDRNLAVGMTLLLVAQFAAWLPQYLTWPLFSDHDVFNSMAREWSLGRLPYRQHLGNNFPGTIYLFHLAQALPGSSVPRTFLAIDAAMLAGLLLIVVAWSKAKFARIEPGLANALAIASYYFALNYSQTAQRDWHAPVLSLAGLLLLDGWSKRTTTAFSAVLLAAAICIRPQAVVFLPVFFLELYWKGAEAADLVSKWKHFAAWSIVFTFSLFGLFGPIFAGGLTRDFLKSIQTVAVGGVYNRTTLASFARTWIRQASEGKVAAMVLALAILPRVGDKTLSRAAGSALLALGLASLYKPMSPYPHQYLNHPLALFWCWGLAVAVELLLRQSAWKPSAKFVVTMLVLALGVNLKPAFCALPAVSRPFGSYSKIVTQTKAPRVTRDTRSSRPPPLTVGQSIRRFSITSDIKFHAKRRSPTF